ncbi:MAG: hypothetical protein QOE06_1247 [Thermoleophilaceae bacterium]|jgi:hypothetical protein|nr:hypothetical protein [Thermoleophilaceae bacterium]
MRKRVSKKLAVVTTVAALAVVGLVYAAWTTTGSGSGYAKAGTAQALTTVDVSASTSATLYPGGPAGDVTIKIDNPNTYPVTVTTVTGSGSITADAGHPTCTTTGVSFTNQSSLTISVPAKVGAVDGSTQTTLTGAASMSNASVNGCQGATFTIPVTLSGNSG